MTAHELGATHYRFRPDVRALVRMVEARWPQVIGATYVGHPWPGWDGLSVDFWEVPGRGYPIDWHTAASIRAMLMGQPGKPLIRHHILGHALWTSWAGYSHWRANDHSGRLRHLHVTYWP